MSGTDHADDVKMFAPAYAIKRGYSAVTGRIRHGRFFKDGEYYGREVGSDVFLSAAEALEKAEQLRLDRIESLRKSLARVESVGPHSPHQSSGDGE